MKVKVTEIIKSFLDSELLNRENFLMGNHTIQFDLPKYGKVQYGIPHNPETYSRTWRIIRADYETEEEGISVWEKIKITEKSKEKSREKHFIIEKFYLPKQPSVIGLTVPTTVR